MLAGCFCGNILPASPLTVCKCSSSRRKLWPFSVKVSYASKKKVFLVELQKMFGLMCLICKMSETNLLIAFRTVQFIHAEEPLTIRILRDLSF